MTVDVNAFADAVADEWVDTCSGVHGMHKDLRIEHIEDRRSIDGRHPVNSQLMLNKTRIREALGGKCCVCGDKRVHLLDVHHRNGDGKEERNKMSNIPYWRHIWREVKQGSKRYELMCKNCHYDHHRPADLS